MIDEMSKFVSTSTKRFKRKFYGRTFQCPVCHLELAHADVDENGLLVCPLCGVVLEVAETYGHTVPIVHDVELFRPQPKKRIHPMAAHFPIGLFPFALLGAVVLVVLSAVGLVGPDAFLSSEILGFDAGLMADAILFLLLVSTGLSLLTFGSGFRDWKRRYRGRSYRVISLKILFSAIFVSVGAIATALHGFGLVFSPITGLIDFTSVANVVFAGLYLVLLALNMVVIATLGHVGGNLVYGK